MPYLGPDSVKPGVYRHFKGNIYHVYGVGYNPDSGQLEVWCVPRYGEFAGQLTMYYLGKFLRGVDNNEDRPGYVGPRFELIEARDFLSEIR